MDRMDRTFINQQVTEWCALSDVTAAEKRALEHGIEIGIAYARKDIKSDMRRRIIQEWVMWQRALKTTDVRYGSYGQAIDDFLKKESDEKQE